jgi:uncharacterized protein YdhG (YjbR/CyaY superfamily)
MRVRRTVPTSVDAYIDGFPPAVQRILTRVRSAVRSAIPAADEGISYGMPTYKLEGRAVIYFAGWKNHYSVYPATAPLVASLRNELAPYEVNDKGTIRFPLSEPVPATAIAQVARFGAREVAPTASRPGRSRGRRAVATRSAR